MEKLLLLLYSPSSYGVDLRQLQNICPRRGVHSLWNIVKSTRLLRKKLEESPLQQPMLNIRPVNDTMLTSIVLVTQIILRT